MGQRRQITPSPLTPHSVNRPTPHLALSICEKAASNVKFDCATVQVLALIVLSITMPAKSFADDSPQIPREQLDFFEAKVRPLLVQHCYECHSVESGEASGELLIDSAAAIQKGGVHGRLLIPGQPDKSLLMRVVGYRDRELQMPPDEKLDDDSIETLRRWVEMGAPDPREAAGDLPDHEVTPMERDPSTHWAFNPPQRAKGANEPQARDLIDALASERSREAGLEPNAPASPATLARRLYFDLTGLAPTAEQLTKFTSDDRPTAYGRLVDQLLASPEFGERFGRHWLDVARYADTVGYALGGKERRLKGSDQFRDWTIRAFASDMPYDEMLQHQLAGDRTDPNNEQGNLDAMGFLTLGRRFLNPLDTIDDRIDVITRGLLGMTVSCARCHDHKFDPIPTSDYYAMGGIIFSSEQPKDGASPLMMVDKKQPVDSPILIRGQPGNRGPIAPRQFLTALRKPDEPRFTDGSGRWELVQRITAKDNPLTARVMVNRLWAHLIGKPLIETPSDFGFRTQPPAIPELLDDLATEFSEHWSIKRIVRRIVLTRIYRQSNKVDADAIAKDPDNRWLTRANRKRRDFESLRDSVLQVSNSLDRRIGGAPVEITLDTPAPRRTIYAMIDRQNLPALFRTFDFASPDAHSPKRYFTTVPQQALFMLNNQQMIELARRTAATVTDSKPDQNQSALATKLFQRVLGRTPSSQELIAAAEFLNQPVGEVRPALDARAHWAYGTAKIDRRQAISDFQPLTVFKDSRWQGGKEFPTTPPLGYSFLSAENGHTPTQLDMAIVRRLTVPFAGQVKVQGQMGHRNDAGDGIQASIWAGERRLYIGKQKMNNFPYGPFFARVEAGETIDFVASPGESNNSDTFFWRATVQLTSPDGRVFQTDSNKHFSGPFNQEDNKPLSRLAQLAQTLMMSNEFAFVD